MSDSSILGDIYICMYKYTAYKINMYMYIFCYLKQMERKNKMRYYVVRQFGAQMTQTK